MAELRPLFGSKGADYFGIIVLYLYCEKWWKAQLTKIPLYII
ncbi:TPA: hypothetical protein ACR3Y6_001143 [Bacillus thuringiensis]|nr:hypothetical protein bcere0011_23870 [Bacillus cereus m1550]